MRRAPKRSPSAPADSISTANASVYASTTHCRPATFACRSAPIRGNAMLTMVTSSCVTTKPTLTVARTRPRAGEKEGVDEFMTGLDPDLRFDRHKAGIQANRYVRDYGLRLMPELYEVFNPMPYRGAQDMEVELAIGLREAGYGVWQA